MLAEIIGISPTISRLKRAIPKLAAQDTRLVIIGEPGVGKSLLVAHIHKLSPRASFPLQSLDMSILKERDQRTLLLGGGYPGLTTTRRSVLEHPTTVLIKHIDHTNAYLQDELAKCLTTMKIRRSGRREYHNITSRVVFALNNSPSALYRAGRITPSLYFILQMSKRIYIPPLRRRAEDIPKLAEHFLPDDTNPLLLDALKQHQWRENVLELKVFLRSIKVPSYDEALRDSEKQELAKMMMLLEEGRPFSIQRSLTTIGNRMMERALSKSGGDHTQAARLLGLTESTLRRRSNTFMLT
jgi:DNA-binding NtrC family response regulator